MSSTTRTGVKMSRRSSARRPKGKARHGKMRERLHVAFGMAGALAMLFTVIAVSTQRPWISDALAQDSEDAARAA